MCIPSVLPAHRHPKLRRVTCLLCLCTSSLPHTPLPTPQTRDNSNRGVEWETWLVGLQHKLLLGVAPKDGASALAAKKGDSGNRACTCRVGKQQHRSAGCKRCGGGGGSRYLYRMVEAVADISERVSSDSRENAAMLTASAPEFFLLAPQRQPEVLGVYVRSRVSAVSSSQRQHTS